MRYFSAGICEAGLTRAPPHMERAEVPVGEVCLICRKTILPTDHGFMIPTDSVPLSEEGFVEQAYHATCLQRVLTHMTTELRDLWG